MSNMPTTGDVINKIYTPSYSSTQPTPSYAGGYKPKAAETKASYAMGAGVLIDKGKIETEICTNIMLGLAQLQEGVKLIESKKSALTKEDWDSDSDESYKEYVENFLTYMMEVTGFFESLSKKIISDATLFEELDSYINKVISSGANISSWR
ncbi:argonaute-like protein implicated in RNA metabolism and viral defense [Enterococcus rotai]|uniref:Uncharacterized protein n=1 Tax=Enterococcus rotai TaxID=118060 RepID=A0A0U2X948_9ENTE|nr:hypothetical protein [Enterococcus rotai]ALS36616.1 hypothetical protein ATZ35_05400 [Enterococcus rotai]